MVFLFCSVHCIDQVRFVEWFQMCRYKIQEETSSHDPCEDAVAAMRLYKRIRSQRHAGDFDVSQLSLLNGGSAKSVYSYSEPTFYCWCLDSMIVSVDDQQGEIYGLSAA